MASRTKWTLESLGDDEDEEYELPQLKEISRAALADPNFDTEAFLLDHCQFRTLKDIQRLIKEWESKLELELCTTVNSEFDEFIQIVESTRQCVPSLENLKHTVSKFGEDADQISQRLYSLAQKISQELDFHRCISIEEARAQKMLHMFDLLEDLETIMPDLESSNCEGILTACKMTAALGLIANELQTVKAVMVLQGRISGVFSELHKKLEQAVTMSKGHTKIELLMAREFLKNVRKH